MAVRHKRGDVCLLSEQDETPKSKDRSATNDGMMTSVYRRLSDGASVCTRRTMSLSTLSEVCQVYRLGQVGALHSSYIVTFMSALLALDISHRRHVDHLNPAARLPTENRRCQARPVAWWIFVTRAWIESR